MPQTRLDPPLPLPLLGMAKASVRRPYPSRAPHRPLKAWPPRHPHRPRLPAARRPFNERALRQARLLHRAPRPIPVLLVSGHIACSRAHAAVLARRIVHLLLLRRRVPRLQAVLLLVVVRSCVTRASCLVHGTYLCCAVFQQVARYRAIEYESTSSRNKSLSDNTTSTRAFASISRCCSINSRRWSFVGEPRPTLRLQHDWLEILKSDSLKRRRYMQVGVDTPNALLTMWVLDRSYNDSMVNILNGTRNSKR